MVGNDSRNIPVLNGLRGLAVLIVFVSHASNIFFHGKIAGSGAGELGVMLFFMLSGFLMAHLYMNTPADLSAQWRFVVNRMARIYPMFAFVVLACFALSRANAPIWVYPIASWHDVWRNVSFIEGYNILWTIGPEVVFYALFLLLWRTWRASPAAFASLATVMVAVSCAPVSITSANSLVRLHDKLPYFLVGCLIALSSSHFNTAEKSSTVSVKVAFWTCLAAFIASFPHVIHVFADVPDRLTGNPSPDPWSFMYYLVITSALFITSLIARPWILSNAIAGFLGRISFSFYLLHVVALANMHVWMPLHPLCGVALALIATTILSSASYALIESPMRRMIRRIGNGFRSNEPARAR